MLEKVNSDLVTAMKEQDKFTYQYYVCLKVLLKMKK